ncbi:unnamed protein product [Ascophyllum nodosum]
MKAALLTRAILGHSLPTGSALAFRLLRSGAMGDSSASCTSGTVVHRDIYCMSGLSALRTTASSLGACLISGGAMEATSPFTTTTYFVAPTTTPRLPTSTATPAMPASAMVAVGVNIWHQCLERPNKRTMQAVRNIAETEVNFTDSLTTYDICKINKVIKQ